MTASEAIDIVTILKCAFPRQEITKETAEVYASFLADLDYAATEQAVRKVVAAAKFFPTIAEIRMEVAEGQAGLPSVAEALAIVANRYRLSDAEVKETPLQPEVKKAYQIVGGEWAFRTSTNPTTLHAQFRDLYAEIRSEAIRGYQHGSLGAARKVAELDA